MTKMKLKNCASVAEIVGAVAVVVSLVYVGIQVNDSAGAARSAAANDVNVALQEWYIQVGSDQQTSALLYRGLVSEQALPDEEEFQFLMMTPWILFGNAKQLPAGSGGHDRRGTTQFSEERCRRNPKPSWHGAVLETKKELPARWLYRMA